MNFDSAAVLEVDLLAAGHCIVESACFCRRN